MANPLNKISQIYLDQVAKINSDPELAKKEREKWQSEAKVDTGKSADEKATARNLRNTPPGADKDTDLKTFITRNPGESLDKARQRVRQRKHAARRGVSEAKVDTGDDVKKETDRNKRRFGKDAAPRGSGGVEYAQTLVRRREHRAKRGVKENFSDWRTDLREIVDETETEAEKKVKEKKIKNKVIINPKFQEALQSMGGTLLEVQEVADQPSEKEQEDATLRSKENRQRMLKKQVLLRKLQAVRSGGGHDIVASYDPIEGAVEYFYEEGINEEGFDQFIEEIGLEEFVDFVDGSVVELNEERAARKASVRAKSYEKVKAEVDKADAARKASKKGEYAPSYAKKETDVTDYGDDKPAAKKAPAKKPAPKPVAKKPAPKPAPKPVAKKVVKAVAKVKKTQPKKPASKEGLRDRIKSAYKAGVKRHRKATQPVRVFHKGMKAGAKKAVKFAKDVKKVVSEKLDYDPMDDPTFDPIEAEKNRGVSGKNNPKGGKKLKKIVKEADLSAAERRALPNKDFALPGKGEGPKGKQAGSYPIPDEKHARSALSLVSQHGTPAEKATVRAKVRKKFPGIKVSEDKAFDNVVGALRKKYGKDAVLTKDSPKPKAQPKPKAKPQKPLTDKEKAHREVIARYGGEDNYRRGRGLGT